MLGMEKLASVKNTIYISKFNSPFSLFESFKEVFPCFLNDQSDGAQTNVFLLNPNSQARRQTFCRLT